MKSQGERLALALRALNSELAGSNRVVANRLRLNESDLAVLDVLHQEGPRTPTDLAHRTRMGTTTMTSVLRRLVRDGWVERKPSESDLRSITIHPTSVKRLTDLFRPANSRFSVLVQQWPTEQADALIAFLEEIADVIHDETDALGTSAADPEQDVDLRRR